MPKETKKTKDIYQLDKGICCFCANVCNPLSQSCGYCSRGISEAAIGLPVPIHLRKYIKKTDENNK